MYKFTIIQNNAGHIRQLKIAKSITNRESVSLNEHLQEIGREEATSIEEEVELVRKIRDSNRGVLERLTKANLRFVVSVVKQYQSQGLSLSDLINESNIGLIETAEKLDETRGFKFVSYAVWWIRQSILQAIAEQSRIVRLSLDQVGSVNKVNKILTQFEQENGRRLSIDEIAQDTDISEDKIVDAMKANSRHVPVDAPFYDDEQSSLLDAIPDDNIPSADKELVEESLREEVGGTLQTFGDREKVVIEAYFGINQREMTLEEVGSKYNLTHERVRQVKEKIVRRLHQLSNSGVLKTYLGQ